MARRKINPRARLPKKKLLEYRGLPSNYDVPTLPRACIHNDVEFYESAVYLEWFNNLDAATKNLFTPTQIEGRKTRHQATGIQSDRFSIVTDDPERDMMTRIEQEDATFIIRSSEDAKRVFFQCVTANDVRTVTRANINAAIAGDVRAQEVFYKYALGVPDQQVNVTTTNINDLIRQKAAERRRLADETVGEFVVVDVEDSD